LKVNLLLSTLEESAQKGFLSSRRRSKK